MKNKIKLENDRWQVIFEIVKNNKAKNIHATIIGKLAIVI